MPRTPDRSVLLDLPPFAGRGVLRAGLMAMRVIPDVVPMDQPARDEALRRIGAASGGVAFIDISSAGRSKSATLLQLEALLGRNAGRRHVILTRLANGHVSEGDRRWVRALGYADLLPEFDSHDCEGSLRTAVDAVARSYGLPTLAPAELARYARVMNELRDDNSPRARVRALTGLAAEALVATLAQSLAITDRTYRLQTYPRCFVGKEAVAWLSGKVGCATENAVAIGQALMDLGLLVHVAREHPFLNEHLFYRLAWSEAADALNTDQVLAGLLLPGNLDVSDRSYLGTTYPKCWVGAQAVDMLVDTLAVTRHEAWVLLMRLMQFGLIEHVTHSRPFIDGHFYYRLTGLQSEGRTR